MADSNSSSSATVSVPLATVLVVLLAVAKLQNLWGLGDLSWWWVFAPYWLGLVVFLGILLIIGLFAGGALGIAALLDKRDARKAAKRLEERKSQRR